jgi:hypothetical protein
MTLWDFARLAGPESLLAADRAATLATALLTDATDNELALTPGAGLIFYRSRLAPVILANTASLKNVDPGGVFSLMELPREHPIRQRVTRVMGEDRGWFSEVLLRAVTPPTGQLAPGDDITSPALGKIGCQLSWSTGQGFMTAGHVAPTKGQDVEDGSGKVIGEVVWANDPVGHGTSIEPDVSVVEYKNRATLSSTIAKSAKAAPGSTATVTSSGNSKTIMGFVHWVYLDLGNNTSATLGEAYFTDGVISSKGDSGGAVTQSGDLIGHIVGASAGVGSYVQSIDYQLKEAAARGGFTSLGL